MPLETTKTSEGYKYDAKFTSGRLTVSMSAIADPCFRIIQFTETMTLDGTGVLFERVHSVAGRRVAMHYVFGGAVGGVRELSLVAEMAEFSVFVHGSADGRQIFPLRFPIPVCGCEHARIYSGMLVDFGDGETGLLAIKFPPAFPEELEALIAVIKKEMEGGQFALPQVTNLAWAGCFWANVACELAAKACIVGCPATGPAAFACIALCLAAEAACLAAVAESKNASFVRPC